MSGSWPFENQTSAEARGRIFTPQVTTLEMHQALMSLQNKHIHVSVSCTTHLKYALYKLYDPMD